MVAVNILRRHQTTITHSASVAHRHEVLNPTQGDEIKIGVENLTHNPIVVLAKDLGLVIWKRFQDLNDWMGGAPSTAQDREKQALLEIHAGSSRHLVV